MSNEYPPPGSAPEPGVPGAPYGQPPAYSPPGTPDAPGGYAGPPQTSPLAIVSLVIGILGVCCGQLFVLSIAAVVTGVLGRKQVREGAGRYKGDGLAVAGLVLGIVGIVVGIVYWVLVATGALDTNFEFSTS